MPRTLQAAQVPLSGILLRTFLQLMEGEDDAHTPQLVASSSSSVVRSLFIDVDAEVSRARNNIHDSVSVLLYPMLGALPKMRHTAVVSNVSFSTFRRCFRSYSRPDSKFVIVTFNTSREAIRWLGVEPKICTETDSLCFISPQTRIRGKGDFAILEQSYDGNFVLVQGRQVGGVYTTFAVGTSSVCRCHNVRRQLKDNLIRNVRLWEPVTVSLNVESGDMSICFYTSCVVRNVFYH